MLCLAGLYSAAEREPAKSSGEPGMLQGTVRDIGALFWASGKGRDGFLHQGLLLGELLLELEHILVLR